MHRRQHRGSEAIAAELGLTITWKTVSFGDVLGRVEKHEIDMSISSMFDRAERRRKRISSTT